MKLQDFKWEMNRDPNDTHDYKTHWSELDRLNEEVYDWFQNNKGNSGKKIRKTELWLRGKSLQIFNNIDLNLELTCWKCNKPIISFNKCTLHHRIYNIKQYFGEMGSEKEVCIVHNKCHKEIHGWD
jgi:hypothetical protein